MSMAQELSDPVYALLADGTTVEIRPAVPDDFDAVKAMHEAMSPDNSYLRFFNISRLVGRDGGAADLPEPGARAAWRCWPSPTARWSAWPATSQRHDEPDGPAEVAFAVADHMHHRGIATLLLEHLVSLARSRGITTFTAETLTENKAMLNVFADAGLPVEPALRRRRLRADLPAAQPGHRPGQLPGRGGRAGAPRRRRQPAARIRARVGRGDRREPAPRHRGPGHPGQHPCRRVHAAGSTRSTRAPGRSAASGAWPRRSTCPSPPTWR